MIKLVNIKETELFSNYLKNILNPEIEAQENRIVELYGECEKALFDAGYSKLGYKKSEEKIPAIEILNAELAAANEKLIELKERKEKFLLAADLKAQDIKQNVYIDFIEVIELLGLKDKNLTNLRKEKIIEALREKGNINTDNEIRVYRGSYNITLNIYTGRSYCSEHLEISLYDSCYKYTDRTKRPAILSNDEYLVKAMDMHADIKALKEKIETFNADVKKRESEINKKYAGYYTHFHIKTAAVKE